jgi:hypothetical protein
MDSTLNLYTLVSYYSDEEDDIDTSIQEEVGIKFKFRVFKRQSKVK